jgi:hypothetical protein
MRIKHKPGCEPLPTAIVPAQPGFSVWFCDGDHIRTAPVLAWEVADTRDTNDVDSVLLPFPVTACVGANKGFRDCIALMCDPDGRFIDAGGLDEWDDEDEVIAYVKEVSREKRQWIRDEQAKASATAAEEAHG